MRGLAGRMQTVASASVTEEVATRKKAALPRPAPAAVRMMGLCLVVAFTISMVAAVSAAASGTVVGWGGNIFGELGNGTTTERNLPVAVTGLSGVTAVAGGYAGSLAVLGNGIAVTWGNNTAGALGDGTTTGPETCYDGQPCSATPVAVCAAGTVGPCPGGPYLSTVEAITVGGNYDEALLKNGTVMAWGSDELGDLGNPGVGNSDVPVPVCAVGTVGSCSGGPYLSGVKAISAGAYHTLALLDNGTVVTWGNNEFGALGDGTTTGSPAPVEVCAAGTVGPCPGGPYLSGVEAVSAGGNGTIYGGEHSLAVLNTGEVVAWGNNHFGQLGDGTSTGPETCGGSGSAPGPCSTNPVPVCAAGTVGTCPTGPYLSGAAPLSADISGGEDWSVALLDNGTAMAWGENGAGQLGDGTTTSTTVPVAVNLSPPAGVTATAVSANEVGGVSLLSNGTVMTWGGGVLGNGRYSDVPVEVCAASRRGLRKACPGGPYLSEVEAVAAGAYFDLALVHGEAASPTIKKLSPKDGTTAGGTSVTIKGANLAGVTAVKFGSTSATIDSSTATSITVETPPEAAGRVEVKVTTANGTNAPSFKDKFRFE